MAALDTEDHRLPAGVPRAVCARAPYVGRPVYLRFAGELYELPAQAPAAWWRAVAVRRALRGSPQDAALSFALHDQLLEVLRVWRPGLSALPERAGRLYRALVEAYGEPPGG